MAPLLDQNSPLLQNKNNVTVPDRTQAMGHRNRRKAEPRTRPCEIILERVNSLLYQLLALVVECRCRFVQQKHLWVAQQSSSDGDSLFLAAAHLRTARTAVRVQLVRERHDELQHVRSLQCASNLVVCGSRTVRNPIHKIGPDGCRKHNWFLPHVPKETPQAPSRHRLDVDSVDCDRSAYRIIEPLDEGYDSTLPASTFANQCNLLARSDGQRQRVECQHVRSRRIPERHIFQLDRFDRYLGGSGDIGRVCFARGDGDEGAVRFGFQESRFDC